MARESDEGVVRTAAPPDMTRSGREVFAFHLRRFLSSWLEEHDLEYAYVTVGFERSEFEETTFELRDGRCEVTSVEWAFEDLCHAYRSGDGRLRIEQRSEGAETTILEVLPILDRPASGGTRRVITGFILLPEIGVNLPPEITDVQSQGREALAAARRNGVRMFFDEAAGEGIKPTIYELFDRLPEWFGCDHSASLIMTSTLETMALAASRHGRFDVLAERLYLDDEAGDLDRLVGMSVLLDDPHAELLSRVVERQLEDPELPYQIYVREGEGWRGLDGEAEAEQTFYQGADRPDSELRIFAPMLIEEDGERELLGFLCLNYRRRFEMSSAAGEILSRAASRLSEMLRYSSLYMLSAQKLWILRHTRELTQEAMRADRREEALDDLLAGVRALIAHHGSVPSFAVGYVVEDETGDRALRYTHPHGWTHYESLTLPVDVPPEGREGSGVSALAVRLNRPFVLAGGYGEGETQAFKNELYVDEFAGEVVDRRHPSAEEVADDEGWRPLSDYYKAARWRAYATLAYPIAFGEEAIGVVTVEVDRSTDWDWWTGFGGQLFWEMLADELAMAFWSLDLPVERDWTVEE